MERTFWSVAFRAAGRIELALATCFLIAFLTGELLALAGCFLFLAFGIGCFALAGILETPRSTWVRPLLLGATCSLALFVATLGSLSYVTF